MQFVWISKGDNDNTKSKILPNGVIELILNFGNKQKTLNRDTLKFDGSCLTNESVMYVANKIFFYDKEIG